MAEKLLGFLDTRLKFVIHILFISAMLYMGFYLMNKYIGLTKLSGILMFIILFGLIYIIDGIADLIFNV